MSLLCLEFSRMPHCTAKTICGKQQFTIIFFAPVTQYLNELITRHSQGILQPIFLALQYTICFDTDNKIQHIFSEPHGALFKYRFLVHVLYNTTYHVNLVQCQLNPRIRPQIAETSLYKCTLFLFRLEK